MASKSKGDAVAAILKRAKDAQRQDEHEGKAWQDHRKSEAALSAAWEKAECLVMPSLNIEHPTPAEYLEQLVDLWVKEIGPCLHAAGFDREPLKGAPEWLTVALACAKAAVAGNRDEMIGLLKEAGGLEATPPDLFRRVRHWLRTRQEYHKALPTAASGEQEAPTESPNDPPPTGIVNSGV